MTSPNQLVPSGAFVIGGGDLKFGQDYTSDLIKQMFQIPEINLGNALETLENQLLKMPLEALEVFKPFIPDWLEGTVTTVVEAVAKIMSILVAPIKWLSELDFQEFLDKITNSVGSTINDAGRLLRSAWESLEGIDFSSPGGVLRAILQFAGSILDPITGLIPDWLLGPISIGRLTGDHQELLADGGFDVAASGDSRWYQGTNGRTSPGCVSIDGTSVADELLSSPVGVTVGQSFAPSVYFSRSGGTGSSGSVGFGYVEFLAGERLGLHVVDSASPAGTGGYAELSGGYTVPAGVDQVSPVLFVTDGFTGGTVSFDDWSNMTTGTIEQSWVRNLIPDLANLLDWLESLVNQLLGALGIPALGSLFDKIMDLGDEVEGWFDDTLSTASDLSNLLGKLLTDPGEVIGELTQNMVNGLESALSGLTDGIQDVINRIYNGFANLGELLDFNRSGDDVISTIFSLFTGNLSTQSAVSTLEAEIRLMKSEGNTIADNFERASAGSLGGDYTLFHSWGGGSGSIGTDGGGNAVWKPSGGSTRGLVYRRYDSGVPAQLTTDSCAAAIVLASDPPDAGSPGAFTYVPFSMSSSGEVSYGRMRIGRTKVAIESVLSGTVTQLVEFTANPRGGQTVEIQRGETGNTSLHKYVLRVNNTAIATWTDPGSTIKSGSGFRGTGLGMQAASREIVPIFLYEQWSPAAAAVVSYREVL